MIAVNYKTIELQIVSFMINIPVIIISYYSYIYILYATYDVLQRYRQGNICRRHPAVKAIYIYCTIHGNYRTVYSWLFPILDSTYTEAFNKDTNQLTHHHLGCMEYTNALVHYTPYSPDRGVLTITINP